MRGRIGFVPPLQTQQRQIHVRSYSDLVNALGNIISNYNQNSNVNSNIGYEIVFADSFELLKPIRLQEELSGIKFTSLGMIPIFPRRNNIVDAMFEVRGAKGVIIESVYCASNPVTGTYFRNFIKTYNMDYTRDKDSYLISKNVAECQCIYNEDVACIPFARILHNIHSLPESGIADIIVKSDNVLVDGNQLGGDGADFSGEETRICNNDFNDGDVFTSGSGSNILTSNTSMGVGSSTGSDEIGPPFGGGDGWIYVKLASDHTNSTTTATDVPGLSFTPEPNKQYEIEGRFFVRSVATTTGAQIGVVWPTGIIAPSAAHLGSPSSATALTLANVTRGTTGSANATGVPSTTLEAMGKLEAVLTTGGSPSGAFKIRLDSEVAASETRMLAGSFIRYRLIPE